MKALAAGAFNPGEGPSRSLLCDYKPSCGPSFETLYSDLHQHDGMIATATGWGDTSYAGENSARLKKASMTVWSKDHIIMQKVGSGKIVKVFESEADAQEDERKFDKDKELTYHGHCRIPHVICAYGDGEGTCQGDSGGPLFVTEKSGHSTLIGVSSSVAGQCDHKKAAGVFARVSAAMSWIKRHASDFHTSDGCMKMG